MEENNEIEKPVVTETDKSDNCGDKGGDNDKGESNQTKEEEKQPVLESCCGICKKESNQICSNCKKVSYCSREHQKEHWKQHKLDCFPAEIHKDEIRGRYLVATRLIKQGEVFFKEKPLISAPSTNDEFHPICLSCYQIVRTSYRCSKCSWPVCNQLCEGAALHSKFECELFSKKQVLPSAFSSRMSKFFPNVEYENVKVLRGLLLRNVDPKKFAALQQLEPHTELRNKDLSATFLTASAINFIQNVCGLEEEFDLDLIKFVSGVIHINGMGSDDLPTSTPSKLFRSASYLFFNGSMATHSCTPNVLRVIQLNSELQFKAIVPIQAGEPIRTVYSDALKGTMDRRLYLLKGYYFECNCERCADPTEFNTHFSSVKCQKCRGAANLGEDEGCLLSIDPLNSISDWKCNSCNLEKPSTFISDLIRSLKLEVEKVPYVDSQSSLERLENILKKHQGVTVHRNHYQMVSIEYDIVQRIDYLLKAGLISSGIARGKLAKRQIELCRKCLRIATIIWPGDSQHRGRLLYFLQSGLLNFITQKVSTHSSKQRPELKEMLREAIDCRKEGSYILNNFPNGRDEFLISQQMKEDSVEFITAKRYLNIS